MKKDIAKITNLIFNNIINMMINNSEPFMLTSSLLSYIREDGVYVVSIGNLKNWFTLSYKKTYLLLQNELFLCRFYVYNLVK